MTDLQLPTDLLPSDGRFGCGPSLVRKQQTEHIANSWQSIMGTSHRKPAVKDVVGRVREGLATFFELPDGYEILLANGGSTAFWDAASFGLIERRAQLAVFGEFGGKFAKAARAPWLEKPEVREAPVGDAIECAPAEGIDVYAYPQNETSTGAMLPVRRVAADGALTVVDATSAAGGTKVDLAETDVYYFAPQKNFGGDGGLWFAAVSPAAIERIERIAASDRYIPEFLSLKHAVDNSRKNQTLNTPAIASLLLLESQLEWLNASGGMDFAASRTNASSAIMYEWAEASSFATPFVSRPEIRSSVVATIDLDERVDAAKASAVLRENGILDTEPYRKLGRNQLRIACFTSIDPSDIKRLTKAIDWVVERLA
ncbi:phosphoserine transaminase [Pseudoclavibacter albus]|uniref:phosphoserine transaminase n=1 Tax=Pseudoclavibacter albus TaxID=272241 RepID=UPI0008270810|nr:phosphoserine transaminase [Pseudoclavibacter alba]